jgi:putative intracellular protease/amidase
MEPIKILVISTSHAQMGDSNRRTGLWLEELAVPYYIFKEAKALLTLATPNGGEVPVDPRSESIIVATSTRKRFQSDPEAISWFAGSIPISTMKAENFDLVFLPGGHGPMWDFPDNESLTLLLADFNRQNKPMGFVSHGTAAILKLLNSLGEPLVKGRKLTAYSNSEEQLGGLSSTIPFLLESELVSLGASYSKGLNFESHMVIDGNIITGQNPASAKEVAKNLLLQLKMSAKKAEAALN